MTARFCKWAPVPWLLALLTPALVTADSRLTGSAGFESGAAVGVGGSGYHYPAYGGFNPAWQGPRRGSAAGPIPPGPPPMYKFRELDEKPAGSDRRSAGGAREGGRSQRPYRQGDAHDAWRERERRLAPKFRPLGEGRDEQARRARRYVPGQRYGTAPAPGGYPGYPRLGARGSFKE